jgi:DNA primase
MKKDRKEAIIKMGVFPLVIRQLFPDAKQSGKDQILVHCPFHQDSTPSLSVNTVAGLFHCFACGAAGNGFDLYMKIKSVDFKTALAELEALASISPERGRAPVVKQQSQVVATFVYHDAKGNRRYWKKRYEPGFEPGRKKSFAFFHDDQGREKKGRGGDSLLYNLHRLVTAPQGEPIYFLEGEAKADALTAWGLYATSLDSGGQSGKGSAWREGFKEYFKGREVVILPDNDETGEIYASSIAGRLLPVASAVKILRLPNLPPKGDVIDWIASHSAEGEKP